MDIIFKRITIIDKNEKKAKIQDFKEGLNLVSSADSADGNYTGKSTLLRSLYYTLGADVLFDSSKGWQQKNKYYYILDFLKDGALFSIIRNDKYFAVFDEQKNKLFETYNREELSEYYSSFFKVSPYLQSRSTGKYKLAAPFALFVFSFIDQKKYVGNSFESFLNQDEFKNYDKDLILFHLGINNEEFNSINDSINELVNKISKNEEKVSMLSNLLEKAKGSFDEGYCQSFESLEVELNKYKKEYESIIIKQGKLQKDLYDLYSTKSKLLEYMNDLKLVIDATNPSGILKTHKCPLCDNVVGNYTEVFFKRAKSNEDFNFQLTDCQSELVELERRIENELEKYRELSEQIRRIEENISSSQSEALNIAKSIGYQKCIESITSEYSVVNLEIDESKKQLKKYKNDINIIQKSIDRIDKRYSEVLRKNIREDNITIIDLPKDLSISKRISCSDNYVFSVVWLSTMNQLKKEFNENGVFFPIVYDNPTNRDFDYNNMELVLKYIYDNTKYNKQVFVSKVCFKDNELLNCTQFYEIKLSNPKYSLLDSDDYNNALEHLSNFLKSK